MALPVTPNKKQWMYLLTNISTLSAENLMKTYCCQTGIRQFDRSVPSTTVFRFKVLNDLLLKVHFHALFIQQNIIIIGISTSQYF